MGLFNSIYTRVWYKLLKNNEVMVVEVVCLISWCTISCVRGKKDLPNREKLHEIIVKQICYKNPHRKRQL